VVRASPRRDGVSVFQAGGRPPGLDSPAQRREHARPMETPLSSPSSEPLPAPSPQSVLVTGAFGNVGRHVLRELLARGHKVRAFALPTAAPRRDAARFPGVEGWGGDLRDAAQGQRAGEGQEAVAHLAFLLPPASERDPDRARAVNVEGARHLVAALEARAPGARFLYSSSYAVFGDTRNADGLLTPDSPVSAISRYNEHKLEVEGLLRASRLRWCILRLGVVLSAEQVLRQKLDPLFFDLPADCRQEFVHGDDVAAAFAACLQTEEAFGKVLLIGGGKSGQLEYLDLINRSLGVLGIPPLPEEAFSAEARQGGGWMDTRESQRLLGYQRWTFEAHLEDTARKAGARRWAARAVGPLIRWYLLRLSPYYRRNPG